MMAEDRGESTRVRISYGSFHQPILTKGRIQKYVDKKISILFHEICINEMLPIYTHTTHSDHIQYIYNSQMFPYYVVLTIKYKATHTVLKPQNLN